MVCLPTVKKVSEYVYSFPLNTRKNVTDGRIDTRQTPRKCTRAYVVLAAWLD